MSKSCKSCKFLKLTIFFKTKNSKQADKSSLGAKGLAYCNSVIFFRETGKTCQLMNAYRNVKKISNP